MDLVFKDLIMDLGSEGSMNSAKLEEKIAGQRSKFAKE
tara:strand:+ start:3211 stop:3324 length:114 start_codon:yes stop_codon:yes gene_type:complete